MREGSEDGPLDIAGRACKVARRFDGQKVCALLWTRVGGEAIAQTEELT
jgi:hypothetical protein